jgi:DNA-binding transcriptional LysR family regulator
VGAYPDIVVEVLIEQAFTNIVERRLDAGIRLGDFTIFWGSAWQQTQAPLVAQINQFFDFILRVR